MSGYVRHHRFRELHKKPGSSRWWAFIPNPNGGRQLRESTGHTDDRAAHAWYLERVRQRPAHPSENQKERSLRDALNARVEWMKAARLQDDPTRRKLSQATIDFYVSKGRHLTRVLGADTLLSEIGHEEVRGYIMQRTEETSSGSTIAKELTALSMAMRFAKKDGVHCEAFQDIKPDDFVVTYVPKKRWLSEAEVDALLTVLVPKRGAVVAFIVATSATYPSEVVPVERSMVDAKNYVVHIPGTKRGSRKRTIVVPSHARRFLDYAVKHATGSGLKLFEPWGNVRGDLHDAARLLSMCPRCRSARLAWARHEGGATKLRAVDCAACGRTPAFAALSPNDLRRTFAQWLVRSGVPNELVSPLMGHKSTRMVEQVYGKRDATAVADLVELALRTAPKGALGCRPVVRKRAKGS
jgi:integrase